MKHQFIPRDWRWKFRARTEAARLTWLVRVLEAFLKDKLSPRGLSEANIEMFIVITAWVRRAVSYTRAVDILIRNDEAEAATPIERALLEIWTEFLFLLDHGDPRENAARVQATANLEYRDFLIQQGYGAASIEWKEVEEGLARFQRDHPSIVSELERARKSRRFHWSGLSRTQLGIAAFGPGYRTMYGILSLDAHPVVTSARDYSINTAGRGMSFQPFQHGDTFNDNLAFRVGGAMFLIWERYAATFRLPGLLALSRSQARIQEDT